MKEQIKKLFTAGRIASRSLVMYLIVSILPGRYAPSWMVEELDQLEKELENLTQNE